MLALVTGASAGFGYSISKKLIESGYKVIGWALLHKDLKDNTLLI